MSGQEACREKGSRVVRKPAERPGHHTHCTFGRYVAAEVSSLAFFLCGERERESERERDRQTDRRTDRQTERDRDRDRETDRDTERDRDRERECLCVYVCVCVCMIDR